MTTPRFIAISVLILAGMAWSIIGWTKYGNSADHFQQACQVLHAHHLTSEGC